jgi:hypothetical protein
MLCAFSICFLNPEYGGSAFLRIVDELLSDYTVSNSWKVQILRNCFEVP